MTKTKEAKTSSWEIKDRSYFLIGKQPLTFMLPSRHNSRKPLLWFNEETGEQLEIRYATNQNSPLVAEQKGEVTLGHVVFKEGTLFVPKEKQNLQKLLSLYHPLKNVAYRELDKVKDADSELDMMNLTIDALNAARDIDIDLAEAIMRVEIGSGVNKMSSKELKRDLLVFAKSNPTLFLQLANDENIQLRNIAVKATEERIITLSQDQRTFSWASNGKKLMKVPFEENPYSAFAAFLKTDEGVEVFKSIEKKLK